MISTDIKIRISTMTRRSKPHCGSSGTIITRLIIFPPYLVHNLVHASYRMCSSSARGGKKEMLRRLAGPSRNKKNARCDRHALCSLNKISYLCYSVQKNPRFPACIYYQHCSCAGYDPLAPTNRVGERLHVHAASGTHYYYSSRL